MIRVGFMLSLAGEGWLGGLNYFNNLFTAILMLPDRRITPVVLINDERTRAMIKGFPPLPVIHSSFLNERPHWGRPRRMANRIFRRDLAIEGVLRWHRIAALSHSHRRAISTAVPSIAWIPDFQHVHLPEFFNEKEISMRDAAFSEAIAGSQRVILSSRDAERDFRRLYPHAASKARVLHFVSGVPDERTMPSRADLSQRYPAAQPYFIVANQFWIHKNHRLIIDALHILKAQGFSIPVLATGSTQDYRWPDYYNDLMRHGETQGVLDRFHVLGVVPREDLLGLMKHAVAILNPSKFEGWNTSIEEAKALGVRVIASDIAVHREQAAPNALYVDSDRPEQLASAMAKAWAEKDRSSAIPIESFAVRRDTFARAYEDIVLELLAEQARPRTAGVIASEA